MVFQEWRVGAKFTRPKKMSELNKQNPLITYIFELGLIKSVDEVKEFMEDVIRKVAILKGENFKKVNTFFFENFIIRYF